MDNQKPDEIDLLKIGYGLRIGLQGTMAWQIWGKNGGFNLEETADFYRVVTLLECPYSEIESILNEYAEKVGAENRFPIWKVVAAGLAFQSDQWASLALTWFPHLGKNEQAMLFDLLKEVAHSKWASQKSRQLANRYAIQMYAADNED
jgi:hypothetical protein